MKKLFFIAVVFSSFLFSSCGDDLEDLLDVNINVPIIKVIDVSVDSGSNTLNKSIEFNLADNIEINNYLAKIKAVEIKTMTYKIIEFNGNSEDEITVSLKADGVILKTIKNENLKKAFDSAFVFGVDDKTALLSTATSFLQNKKINLTTTGSTVAKSPMSFKIEVTLNLGVVASPL